MLLDSHRVTNHQMHLDHLTPLAVQQQTLTFENFLGSYSFLQLRVAKAQTLYKNKTVTKQDSVGYFSLPYRQAATHSCGSQHARVPPYFKSQSHKNCFRTWASRCTSLEDPRWSCSSTISFIITTIVLLFICFFFIVMIIIYFFYYYYYKMTMDYHQHDLVYFLVYCKDRRRSVESSCGTEFRKTM